MWMQSGDEKQFLAIERQRLDEPFTPPRAPGRNATGARSAVWRTVLAVVAALVFAK